MIEAMQAACPSVEELQHELDVIVLELETRIEALLPGDGTLAEAFEDWREAFYGALERPGDEMGGEEAERRLKVIYGKSQEPRIESQVSLRPALDVSGAEGGGGE